MNQNTNQKYKKVAQLVRNRRKTKKITINKVSRSLKLPISTIEALEVGDSTDLSDSYMSGLYKRYGKFLGIRDSTLDRMLIEAIEQPSIKTKKTKVKSGSFVLTNAVSKFIIVVVVIGILSYAMWLAYSLASVPSLSVETPGEYTITTTAKVPVVGEADNDATVLINGDPVSLDANNRFSTYVFVQPGYNSIEIVAQNSFDRSKTLKRVVIFE